MSRRSSKRFKCAWSTRHCTMTMFSQWSFNNCSMVLSCHRSSYEQWYKPSPCIQSLWLSRWTSWLAWFQNKYGTRRYCGRASSSVARYLPRSLFLPYHNTDLTNAFFSFQMTQPHSYNVLVQLPRPQLEDVLTKVGWWLRFDDIYCLCLIDNNSSFFHRFQSWRNHWPDTVKGTLLASLAPHYSYCSQSHSDVLWWWRVFWRWYSKKTKY